MFTSAMQLKDWIKNKSKETGTHANELLQNYMLERLLERISLSPYRENMIIKGGFLIAAMVGVDLRSTMDLDTTIKGLPISREKIVSMMNEIISIPVNDGVSFEIKDIKNIRDISEYDDYRVSLIAIFQTLRVNLSVDITTGDAIIPHEIEYNYKMMFENRTIPILAYNLNTILAEKIETILKRGIGNTRGRDFYDAYLLLSTNKDFIDKKTLLHAINMKAEERDSIAVIENYAMILSDISKSPEVGKIWNNYTKRYHYAKGIILDDIIRLIIWVFEAANATS